VHTVLSNETYAGTYRFNRVEARNRRRKPETEWITVAVEAIVDEGTFVRATARRRSRAPSQVPPHIVGSPTLLTGFLKCGCCGAGMTLATGKGGRYRYYKCNTRIGQGRTLCTARSILMEKLDATVLHALADRVFTVPRLRAMLADLRSKLKAGRSDEAKQLRDRGQFLAAERLLEIVIRDAGASRVYVALGTLRKLGLRDVILSRDGGYLLDPQVKIVVVGTA